MASLVRHPFADVPSLIAIVGAILATMSATCLFLVYADTILGRIGPRAIDAATRIVGFFVAAMGMGLIFHGVTEAIRTYVLSEGTEAHSRLSGRLKPPPPEPVPRTAGGLPHR
jgi:multiple antibiotic resistance protein